MVIVRAGEFWLSWKELVQVKNNKGRRILALNKIRLKHTELSHMLKYFIIKLKALSKSSHLVCVHKFQLAYLIYNYFS